VCRLDYHRSSAYRGYIAMLAVDREFRKRGIGNLVICRQYYLLFSGSKLVQRAIEVMHALNADEVLNIDALIVGIYFVCAGYTGDRGQ